MADTANKLISIYKKRKADRESERDAAEKKEFNEFSDTFADADVWALEIVVKIVGDDGRNFIRNSGIYDSFYSNEELARRHAQSWFAPSYIGGGEQIALCVVKITGKDVYTKSIEEFDKAGRSWHDTAIEHKDAIVAAVFITRMKMSGKYETLKQ